MYTLVYQYKSYVDQESVNREWAWPVHMGGGWCRWKPVVINGMCWGTTTEPRKGSIVGLGYLRNGLTDE